MSLIMHFITLGISIPLGLNKLKQEGKELIGETVWNAKNEHKDTLSASCTLFNTHATFAFWAT